MDSILFCALFAILQWTGTKCIPANEMKFEHMKVLDDAELDSLRQKNEVSAVYYYKRDVPRLKGFLKELDNTAEYLKLYGVEIGFFDCGNLHEAKEPKCTEHNAEFQIFTYKGNSVLLELGLETMFDVNSIMSNMLQLVLIHDVPILQSVEERLEFENKYKGQKDIIFTYQKAIGTFEHRIFMEVAFAYQGKFKFAVCTNKLAVQDLKDHPSSTVEKAIWVLRCKDWTQKDIPCPHWKLNRKHDLATLANFVKILTYPTVFKMPSDGTDIPYYQDKGMIPVVYFFYDKNSEEQSLSAAKDTANAFYTVVGIVATNIDELKPGDVEELRFSGSYPAVAYHHRQMDKPKFMEIKKWDMQKIHTFIIDNLNKSPHDHVTEDDTSGETRDEDDVHADDGVAHGGDEDYLDEEEQFDESDMEEVETQDDSVADAVYQSRRTPPQVDLIDALTDKTFPTTVKHKDLVFVLFYLPFDDKSVAFLYSYADASKEIESDPARPLTRVNCHDWTDICGKENIVIYPTLRMYRNGKMLKDYQGLIDTKAVVTTVKLLNQTNPLILKDSSAIMNIMNGVLPNGEPVITETVVMALLDKSHDKEMKIVEAVSSQLEDMVTFTYNLDGAADKIPDFKFHSPSVVILRRSDILKPYVVYNGEMDVNNVKEFVLKASIPSMPELTVEWFPKLFKQGKPFVILFLDSYEESARIKKVIEDVVLSAKFPQIQFVWMKAEPGTMGRRVLNKYELNSLVPAISYVDLRNGTVFNSEEEYPLEETVSQWLSDIIKGKTTPSNVLEQGDWKPKKKGYDFLSMIDREKERKKRKRQQSREERNMEEQGIGFDKDGNEVDFVTEKSKHEKDYQEDEIREELLALHKTRLYRSKHFDHTAESVVSQKDKSPTEDRRAHEEL